MDDPVVKGAVYYLDRAKELQEERSKAYNNGFTVDDYMLKLPGMDPMFGYLQMMHLKLMRAISCRLGGDESYEGFEDSLVDLINYTAFTAAQLEVEMSYRSNTECVWEEKPEDNKPSLKYEQPEHDGDVV